MFFVYLTFRLWCFFFLHHFCACVKAECACLSLLQHEASCNSVERDGVRFDYAFCKAKMWTSGGHCHSDTSVALGASPARSVRANECFMYFVGQSNKKAIYSFQDIRNENESHRIYHGPIFKHTHALNVNKNVTIQVYQMTFWYLDPKFRLNVCRIVQTERSVGPTVHIKRDILSF